MAETAAISIITVAATNVTKPMIGDFKKSYNREKVWEC